MNNSKEEFLRKFNEAFMKLDTEFIIDSLTDDVDWIMVGDTAFKGKKNVQDSFDKMDGGDRLMDLKIHNIITHGNNAAVNGEMKMELASGESRSYGFCDVYEFNGFKDPKIKKLTAYVVALK